MSMPALTRGTAKVVLSPIDHYVGPRFSRQTWRAEITPRIEAAGLTTPCPHRMGHRTIASAKACGVAMWKRLPVEATHSNQQGESK